MIASGASLRASAIPPRPSPAGDHPEPLELEGVAQPEDDVRLVVDDEDGLLRRRHGVRSPVYRKAGPAERARSGRGGERRPQRPHVAGW